MPILRNAKKALRASIRKTVINRRAKSIAKTMVDAVKKAPTKESVSAAYKAIDKAVKRKVYHVNKASRLKSQLAKLTSGKTVAQPATKAKAKAASKPTKKKSASKKSA